MDAHEKKNEGPHRLRVGKEKNHIQAVKKKKMKAEGRRRKKKSDQKHIWRIIYQETLLKFGNTLMVVIGQV